MGALHWGQKDRPLAMEMPRLVSKDLTPKNIPALKLPVSMPSASAMSATTALGRMPKTAWVGAQITTASQA